jgi:hypothetical protein
VKKIIRRPVFLDDHHDVLKSGNLGVRQRHPERSDQ